MLLMGPASRHYAKCVRSETMIAASVLVTTLQGRFCKTAAMSFGQLLISVARAAQNDPIWVREQVRATDKMLVPNGGSRMAAADQP